MLKSDVRALEAAIASTLRLKTKRVREILAAERSRDRLLMLRVRSMRGCVVVPRPADGYAVLFALLHGGGYQMVATFGMDEDDFAAWRALPAAERAPPEGLPAH